MSFQILKKRHGRFTKVSFSYQKCGTGTNRRFSMARKMLYAENKTPIFSVIRSPQVSYIEKSHIKVIKFQKEKYGYLCHT